MKIPKKTPQQDNNNENCPFIACILERFHSIILLHCISLSLSPLDVPIVPNIVFRAMHTQISSKKNEIHPQNNRASVQQKTSKYRTLYQIDINGSELSIYCITIVDAMHFLSNCSLSYSPSISVRLLQFLDLLHTAIHSNCY